MTTPPRRTLLFASLLLSAGLSSSTLAHAAATAPLCPAVQTPIDSIDADGLELDDAILAFDHDTTYVSLADPVDIPTFFQTKYPDEWYFEQLQAWKALAYELKTDEKAWQNCFKAARVCLYLDEERTDLDLDEMAASIEANIPDSYTNYYIKYSQSTDASAEEDEAARNALQRIPADVQLEDLCMWVSYCYQRGQYDEVKRLCGFIGAQGGFPEEMMIYAYNELDSMQPNGIYVGNGTMDIVPKLYILYNEGEHTDKAIISLLMMTDRDFVSQLFVRMKAGKMPAFEEEPSYEDALNAVKALAKGSKRALYYASTNQPELEDLGPVTYEGILCRVTKKDKRDVKRFVHNWREVYRTSYLTDPVRDDIWRHECELRRRMVASALEMHDEVEKTDPALAAELEACMTYYTENVYPKTISDGESDEGSGVGIDEEELRQMLEDLGQALKEFVEQYEEHKVTGKDDRPAPEIDVESLSESDMQFLFILTMAAAYVGLECDDEIYYEFLKAWHEEESGEDDE